MLKVLLVTVRADYGGGPEHIYQLLLNSENKIDYYVACPDDAPYYNRYLSIVGGNKLYKIPHRKVRASDLIRLAGFAKNHHIEVIHSHGKGAGIYGRLVAIQLNIKCVHTYHGLHLKYNWMGNKLYIFFERILSYITDIVIAVSASEADTLKKYGLINCKKIRVINNGVAFPLELEKPRERLSKNRFTVITVTRFDDAKNPDLLLDIAHNVALRGDADKIEINVIGTGEHFEKYKKRIEQEKLSYFVNLLGTTDLPRAQYGTSDCYLSTSRWEGMPLAMLEAMSEGLPVVATKVVGNKDIVRDGIEGFLFSENLPGSAVNKMIELQDRSLWNILSTNAKNRVKENFNVSTMPTTTFENYHDVVSRAE